MERFLANITSTSWWVGVVLVGIIINIISSYLKPFLDGNISKLSASKKNKLDKERKQHDIFVAKLIADDQFYTRAAFRDLRIRNSSSNLMTSGGLLFLVSSQVYSMVKPSSGFRNYAELLHILMMTASAIVIAIGTKTLRLSHKITDTLREADSRRPPIQQEQTKTSAKSSGLPLSTKAEASEAEQNEF